MTTSPSLPSPLFHTRTYSRAFASLHSPPIILISGGSDLVYNYAHVVLARVPSSFPTALLLTLVFDAEAGLFRMRFSVRQRSMCSARPPRHSYPRSGPDAPERQVYLEDLNHYCCDDNNGRGSLTCLHLLQRNSNKAESVSGASCMIYFPCTT